MAKSKLDKQREALARMIPTLAQYVIDQRMIPEFIKLNFRDLCRVLKVQPRVIRCYRDFDLSDEVQDCFEELVRTKVTMLVEGFDPGTTVTIDELSVMMSRLGVFREEPSPRLLIRDTLMEMRNDDPDRGPLVAMVGNQTVWRFG